MQNNEENQNVDNEDNNQQEKINEKRKGQKELKGLENNSGPITTIKTSTSNLGVIPKLENKINDKNDREFKELPLITKNDQRISNNYDYLFKVSLIGDSGAGKTSVLLRLTENTFKENTSSTIGVDFKILSVKFSQKLAKIQIWDTCGSERFKSLTTSFIKTCAVFVLIFDLTNKKSFENLNYWVSLILEYTSPKVMCLVGNKSDLLNDSNSKLIPKEDIDEFCNKYSMKYLETSAKDNKNIEQMFQHVAISLFSEAEKSQSKKELETMDSGNNIDMNKIKSEEDKDTISKGNGFKLFIKKKKEKMSSCCGSKKDN